MLVPWAGVFFSSYLMNIQLRIFPRLLIFLNNGDLSLAFSTFIKRGSWFCHGSFACLELQAHVKAINLNAGYGYICNIRIGSLIIHSIILSLCSNISRWVYLKKQLTITSPFNRSPMPFSNILCHSEACICGWTVKTLLLVLSLLSTNGKSLIQFLVLFS